MEKCPQTSVPTTDAESLATEELDRKPDSMRPIEWTEYLENRCIYCIRNNIPPPERAIVYTGRKRGVFPESPVTWWTRDVSIAETYSKGGTYGQMNETVNNPAVFEVEITPHKILDFLMFRDASWTEERARLIDAGVKEKDLNDWFYDETAEFLGGNVGLFDMQGNNVSAKKLIDALIGLGYDSIRINEGNIEGFIVLNPSIIKRTN